MSDEVHEVTVSGILAGQFVQTVQHVRATIATPVNAFATSLLISQAMVAPGMQMDQFLLCLPEDYIGTSLRVRRVLPSNGATAVVLAGVWEGESVGQRSGEISSAQVNPLIQWIPSNNPDQQGRLFMPGVSETDIDGMALSGALLGAMQTFIESWIDGGTVGGGADIYKGTVFRRDDGVDDLIFAGQVSPLIGTQRRRLRPV